MTFPLFKQHNPTVTLPNGTDIEAIIHINNPDTGSCSSINVGASWYADSLYSRLQQELPKSIITIEHIEQSMPF